MVPMKKWLFFKDFGSGEGGKWLVCGVCSPVTWDSE